MTALTSVTAIEGKYDASATSQYVQIPLSKLFTISATQPSSSSIGVTCTMKTLNPSGNFQSSYIQAGTGGKWGDSGPNVPGWEYSVQVK